MKTQTQAVYGTRKSVKAQHASSDPLKWAGGETPSGRILVVDDDDTIVSCVQSLLETSGFECRYASSALSALDCVDQDKPDLILLDVGLPDRDGFSVCSKLKNGVETRNIPIIFLSAIADTQKIDLAFDLGAEDYIRKPFSLHELLSKIVKALKGSYERKLPQGRFHLCKERVTLNPENNIVFVDGEEIQLSQKEFHLFKILFDGKNTVFQKEHLLNVIWGIDSEAGYHTVEEYVYRIRKKFGKIGEECIKTLSGRGYLFKPAK